jgi:hypothetical protein
VLYRKAVQSLDRRSALRARSVAGSALIPLLHAALLFAVVPWGPTPFSTPKLAILCLGALASLLLQRTRNSWIGLAWIALVSIGALLRGGDPQTLLQLGAAALLLHSLLERQWDSRKALRWLVWLGCVECIILIPQALVAHRRLDLFGSLGNPDFVAAWLGASLAIALAEEMWLPAILMTLALAMLGSFASVLALGAACLKLRDRRAVLALLIVASGTAGRNLDTRIQGRLQLDLLALQNGALPVHVHNDWLEMAVTYGAPAALLLLVLAIFSVNIGRKAPAAALLSLVARAFVDFPLARPAELALFVTLIAACHKEQTCTACSPQPLPSSLPPPEPAPGATA